MAVIFVDLRKNTQTVALKLTSQEDQKSLILQTLMIATNHVIRRKNIYIDNRLGTL